MSHTAFHSKCEHVNLSDVWSITIDKILLSCANQAYTEITGYGHNFLTNTAFLLLFFTCDITKKISDYQLTEAYREFLFQYSLIALGLACLI